MLGLVRSNQQELGIILKNKYSMRINVLVLVANFPIENPSLAIVKQKSLYLVFGNLEEGEYILCGDHTNYNCL